MSNYKKNLSFGIAVLLILFILLSPVVTIMFQIHKSDNLLNSTSIYLLEDSIFKSLHEWPFLIIVFFTFFTLIFAESINNFIERLMFTKVELLDIKYYKNNQQRIVDYITSSPKNVPTNDAEKNLYDKIKFEKIYNVIFGSQINLLKDALKNNCQISYENIIEFYRSHQSQAGNRFVSMVEYISFLTKTELFENESKTIYKLTDVGKKFISYIDEQYSFYENKNY